jgi:hypothetical protein
VVAAGVIDGNMVTDSWSLPASTNRCIVGNCPVWMAGETTRDVAASMTISRTFML